MTEAEEGRWLLVYDGECGFCRACVDRVLRWDRGRRVEAFPLQDDQRLAGLGIPRSAAEREIWLVAPDGRRWSGAEATARLLRLLPGKRWLGRVLAWPPLRPLTRLAYRWVAEHRGLVSRLTRSSDACPVPGAGRRDAAGTEGSGARAGGRNRARGERAVLSGRRMVRELLAARQAGAGRDELLRRAVAAIAAAEERFHWVGIYLLEGDTLVLHNYLGRHTDHDRIPVGVGVCGTAVAEGRDINVPDVTAVENYLACSVETRAELVVLIRDPADGAILGQLDLDSDLAGAFTQRDEAELRIVAEWLGGLLSPRADPAVG